MGIFIRLSKLTCWNLPIYDVGVFKPLTHSLFARPCEPIWSSLALRVWWWWWWWWWWEQRVGSNSIGRKIYMLPSCMLFLMWDVFHGHPRIYVPVNLSLSHSLTPPLSLCVCVCFFVCTCTSVWGERGGYVTYIRAWADILPYYGIRRTFWLNYNKQCGNINLFQYRN